MKAHLLEGEAVLKALRTGPEGLSVRDVAKRRERYGANIVDALSDPSFLELFLGQLRNYTTTVLVSIAAFAVITSYLFHDYIHAIDSLIILLIVVVNALFGAYQDYRAHRSAALRERLLDTNVRVRRGGKDETISAADLVPGDIILLKRGDRVPADCRILTSHTLNVDQLAFTGESMSVHKNAHTLARDVPFTEQENMLFMNTHISEGGCEAVIVSTGNETQFGKIASKQTKRHESSFIAEIDTAMKKLTFLSSTLIVGLAIFMLLKSATIEQVLLMAAALVIGTIPAGLPAILTYSLSVAAHRLAEREVIVKRKSFLETLGSVDVICADKTGTLTEGAMSVSTIYADTRLLRSDEPIAERVSARVYDHLRACALFANEAENTLTGFVGVAEDIALVDYYNKHGTDIIALREEYETIAFREFDPQTRYASAIVKRGRKRTHYTKGSPETIIEKCTHVIEKGKTLRLTEKRRDEIEARITECASQGLRVIAFAYRSVRKKTSPDYEGAHVLIGFMGMHDPPRSETRQLVAELYDARVDLKMITGDSLHTSLAIAKECGFRAVKGIEWSELKDLSERELKRIVLEYNVFARMSPDAKLKILLALRACGKRIAITGDGINDVPALKEADVGIAMGAHAPDITKESAHIIILNNSIESIIPAVKEGRTVYSNTRKVLNYLLTANLSEIFVVLAATIFNFAPFTAVQLLWVNFVTDVGPALALGQDPPNQRVMKRAPTVQRETIIDNHMIAHTSVITVKKVILLLALFFGTLAISGDLILAQSVSFTWLVLSHIMRIISLRIEEGVSLKANRLLIVLMILPLIIQLVILYTPVSAFFGVTGLPVYVWFMLAAAMGVGIGLAKLTSSLLKSYYPHPLRPIQGALS